MVAVGLAHHELWRDEWQSWMLARDASSLAELLRELRHDGHPPAWSLMLYGLARITRSPVAMQALHLGLATAAVYVLLRYAPFPKWHRVLLAFGYFVAYEYAIISRHYALGVLALFTFCALFPVRRRHPIPLFVSLAALASTSIFGLMISVACAGMLIVEEAMDSTDGASDWRGSRTVRLAGGAWLAVLALVLFEMRPPGGYLGSVDGALATSRWSIAVSVSTLGRAYLPIPDLSTIHFWNTHFLTTDTRPALALALGLSASLALAGVLAFLRRPSVLFMYLAGTGALLAFRHAVFIGAMRHHGHLFLLLVACFWIALLPGREWRLPAWLDRWAGPRTLHAAALMVGVLLVQLATAGILYGADLRRPFSAAPQVAEFLRTHELEGMPIAVSPAPAGGSIAGVLDRPLHYLAMRSEGTFITWGRYPRRRDRNPSMNLIRPFLQSTGSDALVILGEPFEDWDDDLAVTELARFGGALVASEEYVVYRVRQAERGGR